MGQKKTAQGKRPRPPVSDTSATDGRHLLPLAILGKSLLTALAKLLEATALLSANADIHIYQFAARHNLNLFT